MEQPHKTTDTTGVYESRTARTGTAHRTVFRTSLLLALILPAIGAGSALRAENAPVETQAEAITCDARAEIVKDLKGGYSETPVALGVTSAGTVMELWQAPGGATWTIVVTLPNGDACVVGAGNDWMPIQQQASKGKVS
jgi:hypothetical protein